MENNDPGKLAMLLYVCAVLTGASVLAAPTTQSVDLLMPEVQPTQPDTYLCRSFDVANLKPYLTGFVPNANKDIAHHILLYGCDEPGSSEAVWNCGEMASRGSDYDSAPVCALGSRILYAWAMDAPSLSLPEDVAFQVGGNSDIKKLVMQVHYKNVTSFLPPQNKKDSSGLTLITTDEPKRRLAGVYLMVTGGNIPAHSIEYLEAACPFPDAQVGIHPFAFRTHTHTLGRVVAGYRIRDGEWLEIGRQDPRKPQMFYNVTNPGLTLRKGDILAARCTYENNLDHDVAVGNTQNDEMCNFYIMYYVDGNRLLKSNTCFQPGAPMWYLEDYKDQKALNLGAMPVTASVVPGTSKVLEATTMGPELPQERQVEEDQDEEEEEEEDNPVVDELLDDYLARMDPDEVEALVSQMMMEQDQRRPNEEYDRYYFPEDPQ